MNISDYLYDLPEDRIAKFPVNPRDASKLLVYNMGKISSAVFRDLPSLIEPGTMMVYNDTRVIQARMMFTKPSGSRIEIFCLEPHTPPDYSMVFQSHSSCVWKCLVGNARKWKTGKLILSLPIENDSLQLTAECLQRGREHFLVQFTWDPGGIPFGKILEQAGQTPLPPYLNRIAENADKERYQTIYAQKEGSVAAPTAGLHFTDKVLSDLNTSGVKSLKLTLHVGAGTFRPVISEDPRNHVMHPEHFFLDKTGLRTLLSHSGTVIAVGTTSARMLESIYWMGIKLDKNLPGVESVLGQWDAYKLPSEKREAALHSLLNYMEASGKEIMECTTSLMIIPGYRYKMLDALITNSHQPGSTLLLLVAALMGEDWKEVYRYALDHGFRFLSYGDSMYLRP